MFVAKPPATLPHRISGRGETQTRLAKLGARHSSPLSPPSLPSQAGGPPAQPRQIAIAIAIATLI